jgi:hypothetical protein
VRNATFVVYERLKPWKRQVVQGPSASVFGNVGAGGPPPPAAPVSPEPSSIEKAVQAFSENPAEFGKGCARVIAAFTLTLLGGMLGYCLAQMLRERILHADPTITFMGISVPIATGALSVAVFIGVITSAVSLSESAMSHYAEFNVVKSAFDFLKALVAVLALALSIFFVRSVSEIEKPIAVFPLVFDSSRSVGVFSVFFDNAEVTTMYWENKVPVFNDPTLAAVLPIWKRGTSLAKSPIDVSGEIQTFVKAVEACAIRSGESPAVQLRVVGYASSKEFTNEKHKIHPQSEYLNRLAAWTRARVVYEEIGKVKSQRVVDVIEPVTYATLDEMYDARGSIDNIDGRELIRQEDLGRRVDVFISRTKTCSVSEIAKPLVETADAKGFDGTPKSANMVPR